MPTEQEVLQAVSFRREFNRIAGLLGVRPTDPQVGIALMDGRISRSFADGRVTLAANILSYVHPTDDKDKALISWVSVGAQSYEQVQEFAEALAEAARVARMCEEELSQFGFRWAEISTWMRKITDEGGLRALMTAIENIFST